MARGQGSGFGPAILKWLKSAPSLRFPEAPGAALQVGVGEAGQPKAAVCGGKRLPQRLPQSKNGVGRAAATPRIFWWAVRVSNPEPSD